MFTGIVIATIVLVAALLAYAATRPDTLFVTRSATIQAPPEKIFPLINDFHAWGPWSPYEKKDPAMTRTFSGAPNGKGSVYAFEGNGQVGAGRLEITDTSPPSKVVITLDMLKPIEGHNVIEFTLEPRGALTNVTWAMRGVSPFIGKLMGLFINMDRMIGNDFEAGLSNLKRVAEK